MCPPTVDAGRGGVIRSDVHRTARTCGPSPPASAFPCTLPPGHATDAGPSDVRRAERSALGDIRGAMRPERWGDRRAQSAVGGGADGRAPGWYRIARSRLRNAYRFPLSIQTGARPSSHGTHGDKRYRRTKTRRNTGTIESEEGEACHEGKSSRFRRGWGGKVSDDGVIGRRKDPGGQQSQVTRVLRCKKHKPTQWWNEGKRGTRE